MNKNLMLISALILTVATVGCSKKEEQQAQQGNAQPYSAPAGHPMQGMPQGQNPGTGTVVSATHAGGYTYMEVNDGSRQVWIASTPVNVKTGDKIQWGDAAVMRNFSSPTLRRTFDEILFVSNIAVAQ